MLNPKLLAARLITCAAIILFSALTTQAQFRANLQGTVTDPSGAVVSGATVTLVNTETNRTQTATTSDDGFYRFSQLAPGTYNVTAEQQGFSKTTIDSVTISAEDTTGIDIALTTGGVQEQVTISASGATQELETETANIRGIITAEEVRQLPQVGRDPYSLARTAPGVFGSVARGGSGNSSVLIPGVEGAGASSSGTFQVENQTQISANGQRVSSNNFQIDGVSVNSLGQGGAAVVTPNQESVKEIAVVSSSYSAEDGRNTGAQVKVVSQNGTNELHGSAVFNYSSPKLNSFNKFFGSAAVPRRPERVELLERKFAGSLGGPVVLPRFGEGTPLFYNGKDKLFFFVSYEGLRRSNTTFGERFIETPEFRNYVTSTRPNSLAAQLYNTSGIVPRTVATGLTPGGAPPGSVAINGQAGLSYDIGSLNRPTGQKINTRLLDGIPDITLARIAFPSFLKGNQYNTRIDLNATSKDQFAFSTFVTARDELAPPDNGRPFEDVAFQPLNSAATFTYIRTISSNIINEARINFTRFKSNQLETSGETNYSIPELNIADFNVSFGDPSIPANELPLRFGNLGIFGGPNYGASRFASPNILTQNTFEVRDTLTYVRGNQVFKFGGEVRREQDFNNLLSTARPEFVFDNFLSFANDAPFFENIDIDPRTGGSANGQRYYQSTSYGAFVQNDYKVRPNLTLNLGLRYEYQSPLTEKEGRLSNYVFGPNGVVDGRVVPVEQLYEPDRNNFAPRLGFAYSPNFGDSFGGLLGQDRAVIRGGFGIAYDRLFLNQFTNNRRNLPFFAGAGLFSGSATNSDQIVYTFSVPGSPLVYPVNPNLTRGIDPQTGGLLEANPQTLPGGFIRRNVPVDVEATLDSVPNAYVYSYSLELQYQLPLRIVSSIGYQGSAGHQLIRVVDLNRFTPGDTFGARDAAGNIRDRGLPQFSDIQRDRVQTRDANGNSVTPRLTGNPNFNRIIVPLADVNSNYNALLFRLTRNFANNFNLDVNYRFSKSIDTSSFGRGAQQTDPSDQRLNRGPSDFDVKHNLSISGLYRIPFFNDGRGVLGKLLGGFEINGILTAHSGFPFTPIIFGPEDADFNGDGFVPDRPTGYFGGVIENPSNQDFINGIFPGNNPSRYFSLTPGPAGIGRNSFRGPNFRQLDLAIVKQTALPFIKEGARLDIRANLFNAFNLLNLPPFFPVTTEVDTSNPGNFGRIQSGLAGRVVELQARFSF